MGIEAICRWGEKILACRDYPSAKEQFGDWQREVRSALDGSGLSESRKREIGVMSSLWRTADVSWIGRFAERLRH